MSRAYNEDRDTLRTLRREEIRLERAIANMEMELQDLHVRLKYVVLPRISEIAQEIRWADAHRRDRS